MERVLQMFIIVSTLFHLLEAFQQDFVSVIGDNVEIKFSTNKTTFEDSILTFISNNDHIERLIFVDGAVVSNKYRVQQKTADSLSLTVDSVHFSEAGNYVYTVNRTTIDVVRVTVLDPNPNCSIRKQTNGSLSISFGYMFLECIFTYSGGLVPALKWTEDALIDIGVSSSSCKASEQNVGCKIPIRFAQEVLKDALGNALQSGSRNAVATFFEGCNQYKCYWEREWRTIGKGYTIRLDSSKARYLGTLQCAVFPCRILKRNIRSSEDKGSGQPTASDQELQKVGLIGAVTALSLIVAVFGVLLIWTCIKNQYLKRRIDFYIDMGNQKRSHKETRLTESASPPEASESRAQVQLVSFRATDPSGGYVEISQPTPTACEVSRHPGTQPERTAHEPIVLPPMPLPSGAAASTRRSHPTQRDNQPRVPDRTAEDSSRYSEPSASSTEYVKLAQREPLQLQPYAELSWQQRGIQVVAEDSDSRSTAYVNVPKKIRSGSEYVNVADYV